MANYLIIKDGKLYINMKRSTLNRWPAVNFESIEAFRCASGYYFPLVPNAFEAMDVIEGLPVETNGGTDFNLGVLVARDHLLYGYNRVNATVTRHRIPMHDSYMVLGFQHSIRPMIEFGIELANGNVKKALKTIDKISPLNADSMLKVDLFELSDRITKENLPLPKVVRPPRVLTK